MRQSKSEQHLNGDPCKGCPHFQECDLLNASTQHRLFHCERFFSLQPGTKLQKLKNEIEYHKYWYEQAVSDYSDAEGKYFELRKQHNELKEEYLVALERLNRELKRVAFEGLRVEENFLSCTQFVELHRN